MVPAPGQLRQAAVRLRLAGLDGDVAAGLLETVAAQLEHANDEEARGRPRQAAAARLAARGALARQYGALELTRLIRRADEWSRLARLAVRRAGRRTGSWGCFRPAQRVPATAAPGAWRPCPHPAARPLALCRPAPPATPSNLLLSRAPGLHRPRYT
jgi:hypothetical protein